MGISYNLLFRINFVTAYNQNRTMPFWILKTCPIRICNFAVSLFILNKF